MRALRKYYDRTLSLTDEDVEVEVGSFLHWSIALDDRIRELNKDAYSEMRKKHPEAIVMPGLKLARNAIVHGVQAVGLPAGMVWPSSWPEHWDLWRWLPLGQVLDGWTPTGTGHLALQKSTYSEYLDGKYVQPVLESALEWLTTLTNWSVTHRPNP
jgi:hypothetical protein